MALKQRLQGITDARPQLPANINAITTVLFAPLGVLFVVARWRDFFSNLAGSTLRIE